MTAANDGFIKPASLNVGGRAITIPATLRMAANAGQYAKNAIKLNPYLLIGTLALGYLADNLITVDPTTGTFSKAPPQDWYLGYTWYLSGSPSNDFCRQPANACSIETAISRATSTWQDANYTRTITFQSASGNTRTYTVKRIHKATGHVTNTQPMTVVQLQPYAQQGVPVTQADWDALPDPLPYIAPELPSAPYMTEGVPTDVPEYAPADIPLGQPYTRPDGSTAEPRVKITPAGDGKVTIAPYDLPLTDPSGNPVSNPVPEPTPSDTPTDCDKYPASIGCAELGAIPPAEPLATRDIPVSPTVTPVGGAGSCPADITTSIYGLTWSYLPICDFASAIRPLIIGFAWLAFAYIVAGTVRT